MNYEEEAAALLPCDCSTRTLIQIRLVDDGLEYRDELLHDKDCIIKRYAPAIAAALERVAREARADYAPFLAAFDIWIEAEQDAIAKDGLRGSGERATQAWRMMRAARAALGEKP